MDICMYMQAGGTEVQDERGGYITIILGRFIVVRLHIMIITRKRSHM